MKKNVIQPKVVSRHLFPSLDAPPIGPRGVWKDYSDECLVGRGSRAYPDPSEYTDDSYKYVLYYCDTWATD